MEKVHISLVGGQPVPVYLGIEDDGLAGRIVLVCSSQSRVEAERIKAQFPTREVEIVECPPTDLAQAELLAEELKRRFEDCAVTVNLTGGTKLWALSFFRVFGALDDVRLIYVDQTNLIVDVLTKECHRGYVDKHTRFALYGTPMTSFTPVEEFTEEDIKVMGEVEWLRTKNKKAFSVMTNDVRVGDWTEDVVRIDNAESGSSIECSQGEKWAKVKIVGYGGTFEKELQSEHVFDILFNAGWFELKTALELRKSQHVKEVWMNCVFADSDGHAKNEIDIVADLGIRLLFVECKTMVYDVTDIDKFRSALRNFSGTSTSGLFVTYEKPNLGTKMRYQHAVEKCKDNDIQVFNFSMWKDDRYHRLPALIQIVDMVLTRQNKR